MFYFVDIYFALVLNYPSGKAGTQLLYYTPGLGGKLRFLALKTQLTVVVGVYLAMFACNIYPRQTWFPLTFGTLIEPLGMTLLAVAINLNNVSFVQWVDKSLRKSQASNFPHPDWNMHFTYNFTTNKDIHILRSAIDF